MDCLSAIKGRRSVRKYRSDPVPEETFQALMESVRWAPSWANTQCWEIIAVDDARTKAELALTLGGPNPAASALAEAPLVLVLCGRKGVSGLRRGEPATDKGDWLMFDVGLATQTLCLAARDLGLGTVIVGLFDHRKVAEALGVPPEVEVVAMTPLGYPAEEEGAPRRKDVSEFVFFGRHPGKRP
ncbi:MAG TPA: nitroreductase family protein [Spirochaetia bacterium]|nr:nitroreductase family protein [Spirochaetales bacterium]HRY72909.1 nitroreductase family protein [Spirochaetia bacterium]